MNKSEAKLAIASGKKIKHRYFDDHKYVKLSNDNRNLYEFEDGVKITPLMFWTDRIGKIYNDGWYLFD